MSDIRKWLNIMESIPAIFPDEDPKHALIKQDATVMVDPSIGGGTARYMNSTPDGAMVDIKGIARELSQDDFSLPERDYEDPYERGNDWFHVSVNPDTPGTMNDKPEFRAGDMVKVADVYGTVIGPGIGVFVAYGTTGQDCIISFDNKEIIVPVANIAAALEQNAKDNFDQMDNDGNLSPMSFGAKNVKIEEPAMDQHDDFRKWMSAVEEALSTETKPELEESSSNDCGCEKWNCPTCFPDKKKTSENMEVDNMPLIDETDNDFVEKPKSGKGVKLGNIVQSTKVVPTDGHNSPETYGGDNLKAQPRPDREVDDVEPPPSDGQDSPLTDVGEEIPHGANPDDYGKAGRYLQKHFDDSTSDGLVDVTKLNDEEGNWYDPEMDDMEFDDGGEDDGMQEPMDTGIPPGMDDSGGDEVDSDEMVTKIMNIQAMGFSQDDRHYDENDLRAYSPEELKACHDRVMGEVSEAKPTKIKTDVPFDPFDDSGDDILNPKEPDLPALGPDDDMGDDLEGDDDAMSLPTSSRADTQRKVGAITGTDQMRDWMNKIDPMAGGEEPDLPEPEQDAMVVRTAADVPAVIQSSMQAAGMQTPDWHTIDNLPGYMQRNIRGMGRQLFSMFTSTPLENIQTLANVSGQGPNSDAEMRAVGNWLMQNAEDLGKVDVSHGMAIPGYEPDVKEYRANGVRFQVVRDPMGQYIYAYPEKDARLHQGGGQGRLPGAGGGGGMPGQGRLPGGGGGGFLPEMLESLMKPTLFQQIRWDEELTEAFDLAESSLSKLIGKQQGGQQLVRWLHRRHKLSNEAELEPVKFNKTLMWKQFKSNPDNFVIVSGERGVAGIKPSQTHIDRMTAAFQKRGKTYNPAGDSTLPYQIIAYTDDGQQVDPELLRPQPEDGDEEPVQRDPDPTVQKARMGKNIGNDVLNPNNTFRLLNDQIGPIHTVWISGFGGYRGDPESVREPVGSVERGKMATRAGYKQSAAGGTPEEAVQKVFTRVKPVLKTLANQALAQIISVAQRYAKGGNFEGAEKVSKSGVKLKNLLVALDTGNEIKIDTAYGSKTVDLSQAITQAIALASGAQPGTEQFNQYAQSAASGGVSELRPILDALRAKLPGL